MLPALKVNSDCPRHARKAVIRHRGTYLDISEDHAGDRPLEGQIKNGHGTIRFAGYPVKHPLCALDLSVEEPHPREDDASLRTGFERGLDGNDSTIVAEKRRTHS